MSNDEKKKRSISIKLLPDGMDDKDLAIICLTVIVCYIVYQWQFAEAVTVVTSAISAIAGLVTGRALERSKGP